MKQEVVDLCDGMVEEWNDEPWWNGGDEEDTFDDGVRKGRHMFAKTLMGVMGDGNWEQEVRVMCASTSPNYGGDDPRFDDGVLHGGYSAAWEVMQVLTGGDWE